MSDIIAALPFVNFAESYIGEFPDHMFESQHPDVDDDSGYSIEEWDDLLQNFDYRRYYARVGELITDYINTSYNLGLKFVDIDPPYGYDFRADYVRVSMAPEIFKKIVSEIERDALSAKLCAAGCGYEGFGREFLYFVGLADYVEQSVTWPVVVKSLILECYFETVLNVTGAELMQDFYTKHEFFFEEFCFEDWQRC